MQYSNTSSKNGLLQDCEFWTGLGDGIITGTATLKAQFTNRLNRRLEQYNAQLKLATRLSASDDTNYDNHDFSTFPITSGTHDYQFLTTEDGETISDITGVMILPSASATSYVPLDRLTVDNQEALLIMSPNSTQTGTPTAYLERNNIIFFDVIPNYSATGKVFFKRAPSFFTTSDTTKEPGFPSDFHQMLSLGSSYDWLVVNKSQETTTISAVASKLALLEDRFSAYCEMRNPQRRRMTFACDSSK